MPVQHQPSYQLDEELSETAGGVEYLWRIVGDQEKNLPPWTHATTSDGGTKLNNKKDETRFSLIYCFFFVMVDATFFSLVGHF